MGNHEKKAEKGESYLIETKNLCLICFKECTSVSVRKAKLFCRVLERYFSVNFKVSELSSESQYKEVSSNPKSVQRNVHFLICENCCALADKIRHLHQKLELVQMKLHACGQNLYDIMNSAEKVSNRIDTFNDRMASFKERADEKVKVIQNVRREILKKCNTKMKRKFTNSMLPTAKLVIKKTVFADDEYATNSPPPSSSSAVQESKNFPNVNDENYRSALLGCTISFCVVVLLSFLNLDEPETEELNLEKAEVEIRTDTVLSSRNNTSAIMDQMEDIISEERSENILALKTDMNYRKRKLSDDGKENNDNDHEHSILKRLIYKPSESGESTDSVSEDDVIREEWRIGGIESMQENDMPNLIETSDTITNDKAVSAVHAVIPLLHSSGNLEITRVEIPKCDVLTPTIKEDIPTPTHKVECKDENVFSEISEESVQSHTPFEIDVKPLNQQQANSSTSTELSLVPVNNPLSSDVNQLTYKCHVCLERFNSRAKIEKHRVVVHNFSNYVQCPSCCLMVASYFHLELHRRDHKECRMDARRKQMELCDIARPYFPFEIIINGRHFCPFEDCCEVFNDFNNLIAHIQVHGTFHCQFGCSRLFLKGHELAVHELTFHRFEIDKKVNVFKCPRCDFVSKRRDEYIPHFIHAHLNIVTSVL